MRMKKLMKGTILLDTFVKNVKIGDKSYFFKIKTSYITEKKLIKVNLFDEDSKRNNYIIEPISK
jgi:hypothetical protein